MIQNNRKNKPVMDLRIKLNRMREEKANQEGFHEPPPDPSFNYLRDPERENSQGSEQVRGRGGYRRPRGYIRGGYNKSHDDGNSKFRNELFHGKAVNIKIELQTETGEHTYSINESQTFKYSPEGGRGRGRGRRPINFDNNVNNEQTVTEHVPEIGEENQMGGRGRGRGSFRARGRGRGWYKRPRSFRNREDQSSSYDRDQVEVDDHMKQDNDGETYHEQEELYKDIVNDNVVSQEEVAAGETKANEDKRKTKIGSKGYKHEVRIHGKGAEKKRHFREAKVETEKSKEEYGEAKGLLEHTQRIDHSLEVKDQATKANVQKELHNATIKQNDDKIKVITEKATSPKVETTISEEKLQTKFEDNVESNNGNGKDSTKIEKTFPVEVEEKAEAIVQNNLETKSEETVVEEKVDVKIEATIPVKLEEKAVVEDKLETKSVEKVEEQIPKKMEAKRIVEDKLEAKSGEKVLDEKVDVTIEDPVTVKSAEEKDKGMVEEKELIPHHEEKPAAQIEDKLDTTIEEKPAEKDVEQIKEQLEGTYVEKEASLQETIKETVIENIEKKEEQGPTAE